MRSVSFPEAKKIVSFNRRKNAIFWELGIGARSDNFSHEGMAQWDEPRVWGAPTRCCTHQAHRMKKIAEKWRFFGHITFFFDEELSTNVYGA